MEKITMTNARLSIITVEAHLSNIKFLEKDLINVVEPNATVVRVVCNFGEKQYVDYTPPIKAPKSNRGRKKKAKPKKKRQIQGTGKYMNSQITFEVLSCKIPNKLYKVKIFRNGKIQIPGIVDESMVDAYHAINECKKLLMESLKLTVVEYIPKNGNLLTIITRNVVWATVNKKIILNLMELKKQLAQFSDGPVEIMEKSIKYDTEKYQGLKFKVRCKNMTAYSTYKIFRSGKFNLDRCNTLWEQVIIKNWLEDFINENISVVYYLE